LCSRAETGGLANEVADLQDDPRLRLRAKTGDRAREDVVSVVHSATDMSRQRCSPAPLCQQRPQATLRTPQARWAAHAAVIRMGSPPRRSEIGDERGAMGRVSTPLYGRRAFRARTVCFGFFGSVISALR